MRILSIFLSFLCITATAQTLEQATRSFSESDKVKDGRFSFYAVDLASGTSVVSHDIDRKMSPASTMKLITTYAALDILGPDHQFRTQVGFQGEIDSQRTLHGNLVIVAGGDPVLDSEEFQKSYGDGNPFAIQIIEALSERGVKTIKGEIIIDESCYKGIDVPDEWTWQDMGNYYGAGAHAFTFSENRFNLYFNSGSSQGSQTTLTHTDAVLQEISPINKVVSAAINSDQAYVYSSPKSDRMIVHGEIPLRKKGFKVKAAMPNPAEEFKARLAQELRSAGISLENNELDMPLGIGDGNPDMTEILVMESPKLIDITAYTNLKSNNLFAEHLLRQIGKKSTGEGSFAHGLKAIQKWFVSRGISIRGIRLKDGSGLSRAGQVSARTMVELMKELSTENYFEEFMKALPCAGLSGSMRRVGAGTSIAGKMYAKTGYIEGVRAYAGYLEKEKGGLIAFCIMANDYDMSPSRMRKELSKMMVQLNQVELSISKSPMK